MTVAYPAGEPATRLRLQVTAAGRLWTVQETALDLPPCGWRPGEFDGEVESGQLLTGQVDQPLDVQQRDVIVFRGRRWTVLRVGHWHNPWDGDDFQQIDVKRIPLPDTVTVHWLDQADTGTGTLSARNRSTWTDGPTVPALVTSLKNTAALETAIPSTADLIRVTLEITDQAPRLSTGDRLAIETSAYPGVAGLDLVVETISLTGLWQTAECKTRTPKPWTVA